MVEKEENRNNVMKEQEQKEDKTLPTNIKSWASHHYFIIRINRTIHTDISPIVAI